MARNEVGEIISGIFALIVFISFAGAFLNIMSKDAGLSLLISLIFVLGLVSIIIAILKKIYDLVY